MKHLSFYFFALFLVLANIGLHVAGMADLSPEMFVAQTEEEMIAAIDKQRELNQKHLRQRLMMDVDSEPILADKFSGKPGFYHGVASGDPLADSVILWTRFTPKSKDDVVMLELRMAQVDPSIPLEDHLVPKKNKNIKRVNVEVTAVSDFIAKVDVTNLKAGTSYVFAFSDGEAVSAVGQTKTAPGPEQEVESMVYAVFSCSHYANGWFHPYDIASTIKDLDFWVHTGDYVYEYGLYSTYASDSPERKSEILPEWEQISLQDHRNRMATYHMDEGLQNLRRRAPLIACWDDHETTNNPWGMGTVETTGAENHQETCPVDSSASDEEKNSSQCDRDEGPVDVRFTNAAQSYLEWMPLRRYEGTMGVVKIGAINQVISWGDMATVVTFDTRISHRSKEPTLNSSTFGPFFSVAGASNNVVDYSDVSNPLFEQLQTTAATVKAGLEDPQYTMIGPDIEFLRDSFKSSAEAGQPWQIWATATAMGRAIKGNYHAMHELVEDAETAAIVKTITDTIHESPGSLFLRALAAQSLTSTPWNRDDFSGFAAEQKKILAMMKETANNPIILAGDLHDGYAWQLYEDGALEGTPVAVNHVCPGVTSPGWGPFLFPAFSSLSGALGGDDAVYNLLEKADELANPGLKYFNNQFKGFFAAKVTKESHIVEYFGVSPETVLSDYNTVRSTSGGIVADFVCDSQLTTMADQPGSLERSDSCGIIEFEAERPTVWDIPFPPPTDNRKLPLLTDCGFMGCNFDACKPGNNIGPVNPSSCP